MKLAFEEHGSGKPVILLHAFPFSRKLWSRNIEAVTAAGFRLILPDLRGFGESSNFADINSMEDMAGDVAELIGSLAVDRAIIGGISMGGYTLFELFRLVPEKFAAIVLCDTTAKADTDEKQRKRLELIEAIETRGLEAVVDGTLPDLISENTPSEKPEVVAELAKIISESNPKALIAALRGMAARRDNSSILPDINVPAELIFGEHDKVTNLEAANDLKSSIPNSELFVVKQAGHLSNIESPEEFNSYLTDFIKRVEY